MGVTSNPIKATQKRSAESFITGKEAARNITLRFDAGILDRAGEAAKRLGISRNAFFSTAAVEKLEEMGI